MNIKYAAVPIIALAVSACNPVEVLEGRSPFRENQQRLQALTIPEPSIVAPINLADAIAPAPVEVVCVPVFRVTSCVDGVSVPYIMP